MLLTLLPPFSLLISDKIVSVFLKCILYAVKTFFFPLRERERERELLFLSLLSNNLLCIMEIYVLVLIAFVVLRKETSLKLPFTESSLHEWQYGMIVKVSLEPDTWVRILALPLTAGQSWTSALTRCAYSLRNSKCLIGLLREFHEFIECLAHSKHPVNVSSYSLQTS